MLCACDYIFLHISCPFVCFYSFVAQHKWHGLLHRWRAAQRRMRHYGAHRPPLRTRGAQDSQLTGGYSIQFPDVYLTKENIVVTSVLLGPEGEEPANISYPYAVIKIEYRPEPVLFQ